MMKRPYRMGSPKQKMWQSMRIMRCFTPVDIAQTAEVSIAYACAFISTLRRAGYLKRQMNNTGQFAAHQLLKNTGPHAPRHWVKARQVYDVNRGEVHELG
ncbi:hypothetical protein [Shewanella sp. W3-18-1]|uniref:hypothetical protein n=1 Tax=Shewanella sp. (strain W3-18-1) TaxID=351745 RepID=UPI00005FDAD5|nr:hypothetical protein [Shewanella sp. W3-18-1]